MYYATKTKCNALSYEKQRLLKKAHRKSRSFWRELHCYGGESMMNPSAQQIKLFLVLWGIAFEYKGCCLSLGRFYLHHDCLKWKFPFSLLKISLLLKDCYTRYYSKDGRNYSISVHFRGNLAIIFSRRNLRYLHFTFVSCRKEKYKGKLGKKSWRK